MSTPKFTPGPWQAHRTDWRGEPSPHKVYISGDERKDADDETGEVLGLVVTGVAIVEGNSTSRRITYANARLIAAAPDLYEALRGLLTETTREAYDRAIAALKLADEGRQPC